MKKKAFYVVLLFVAGVIGGAGAYIAINPRQAQAAGKGDINEKMIGMDAAPGAHFTSYQASSYPDLTYAAENAVQAVVNIEVTHQVQSSGRGNLDPFLEFFGLPQGYSNRDNVPRERKAGGSGVIISHDGYIVTNHHVVNNSTKLKVKLYDGRIFDATLIGTDSTSEVALIKVEATGLPSLRFGSSDDLRLGEWVLAIGSPFDLQSTITAGIVSAKARNLGALNNPYNPNPYAVESFIQTDAAVNPGNSGGALVNTSGELVGINTLIKSATGTYMGYSFAIPSTIVEKVVYDLKEYGVVQRAMLGISYAPVDQELLDELDPKYKIEETGGIFVATVDPQGAAHAAGIKEGDVITAIDGVELTGRNNLAEIISKYRPNDKVKISLKREGKVKHFDVVLRNKAGKAELLSASHVDVSEALGGRFAEINDRTKKDLKIDQGIRVVEVKSGGILAEARVREGFIITHINEKPIRTVGDLNKITDPVTFIEGVYPNGRSMAFSIVR